jgi:hypothetical protein
VSLFKTESESETDVSPSEYIQNVLKRKVPHDRTFGVYQDDRDGSFKIGRSNFKYKDKHVFVDGRKYKTQGLWESWTRSKPDKNAVYIQDRQAYKQIFLQSNAHRVKYNPRVRSKQTGLLNIRDSFRNCLLTRTKFLGDRFNNVSG